MANPIASRFKQTFKPDFGQYAAMYITIAAFSFVTLISVNSLWTTGYWLPYVIGVVIFAIVSDRGARRPHPGLGFVIAFVLVQTFIVIVLTVLSDYFFLTTMLSFLIVAAAQGDLPRSQSYVLALFVLSAVTLAYAIGAGLNAAAQIFFGLGAGFVFIVVFTELAESERQARQQLQQANQQLAEYAEQVEQLATMRERNRLAREVHDTLGHYLTVINVQLEVVTKLIDSNPVRAKEAATKAKQLASEGLNEVRRSVAALRPTPLEDKPLSEAIRALIETSRDAGLMVTFEQTGSAHALSPEIETVLYRATQESLTNIRKHAHASAANVRLAYDANAVSVRVRDNGLGRKGGEDNVGLSALRERAAALNGTVMAENHLEGGFVLEVTLPLEQPV
jgi:signal transduction histidine kinase